MGIEAAEKNTQQKLNHSGHSRLNEMALYQQKKIVRHPVSRNGTADSGPNCSIGEKRTNFEDFLIPLALGRLK